MCVVLPPDDHGFHLMTLKSYELHRYEVEITIKTCFWTNECIMVILTSCTITLQVTRASCLLSIVRMQ